MEYNKPIEIQYGEEIQNEDKILGLVLSLGTTFTSEAAGFLDMNEDQVSRHINKLVNKGYLIRVAPDEYYPQSVFKPAIARLWRKGIFGYGKFAMRSWVMASEKGIKYFALKYQGEHRQISYAYAIEYPSLELEDEGDIFKSGEVKDDKTNN